MIISNCPRCGEAFRIPADELPDDAYAQCPWCHDTFPMTDVLKALPPVLEVMSADGRPIIPVRHEAAAVGVGGMSEAETGPDFGSMRTVADEEFISDDLLEPESRSTAETVVDDGTTDGHTLGEHDAATYIDDADTWEPDQHSAADEPDATVGNETVTDETITDDTWTARGAEQADDEEPMHFEIEDPDASWPADDASSPQDAVAPMSISAAPPRKKRGGSPIGTAIKVVLGGVLAVPIAGGLLTLMGRTPDWGFWPFDGAASSRPNTVSAAPADLSSRPANPSGSFDAPVGRTLAPDLGLTATNENESGDATFAEIMSEPEVVDLATDNETVVSDAASSIELPAQSDIAIDEPEDFQSETAPNELANLTPPNLDSTSSELTHQPEPSLEMPANPVTELPSSQDLPSAISENPAAVDDVALAPVESLAEPMTTSNKPAQRIVDDPEELVKAADRAGKMVDALAEDESAPKERLRRLLLTYAEISKVCSLATADSEALRSLAAKVKSSSVLGEIGDAAPEWLVYGSRSSEGILLVGQTGDSGNGPTITLDSGTVVSVSSETELSASERVLAMGRIIDENSVELVHAEPLP